MWQQTLFSAGMKVMGHWRGRPEQQTPRGAQGRPPPAPKSLTYTQPSAQLPAVPGLSAYKGDGVRGEAESELASAGKSSPVLAPKGCGFDAGGHIQEAAHSCPSEIDVFLPPPLSKVK